MKINTSYTSLPSFVVTQQSVTKQQLFIVNGQNLGHVLEKPVVITSELHRRLTYTKITNSNLIFGALSTYVVK